jgi:replicative DNA helicase
MTRRAITAIRPVRSVPVRCITVDSASSLYLAGESMIPTHNTSFALGMAAHAAMDAHVPVLFFSLEMSHAEITNRLLCAEARVDATRMRNGKLQESDWGKISHAIGRLGEAPLYIDDNPNLTIMDIRAKARRLKSKLDGNLGLIVIDYLQLMTGRHNAENRQVEVSEISRGLKILARELEVPVVALSQLSRNLEMRSDKRPILADLRESGSLEQDADVVMFLYRDEIYNAETADKGVAEVIVSKHRNGPTGYVRLAFLDHYTRFANMARGV